MGPTFFQMFLVKITKISVNYVGGWPTPFWIIRKPHRHECYLHCAEFTHHVLWSTLMEDSSGSSSVSLLSCTIQNVDQEAEWKTVSNLDGKHRVLISVLADVSPVTVTYVSIATCIFSPTRQNFSQTCPERVQLSNEINKIRKLWCPLILIKYHIKIHSIILQDYSLMANF